MSTDRIPAGISLRDAYSAIRVWYQANCAKIELQRDAYGRASTALIRALPPAATFADVEIVAVFREVIAGRLEWAYHETDGRFKMASYAKAALEKMERSYFLTPEEDRQLETSALWPFLTR